MVNKRLMGVALFARGREAQMAAACDTVMKTTIAPFIKL
jgi:hypothetical protein